MSKPVENSFSYDKPINAPMENIRCIQCLTTDDGGYICSLIDDIDNDYAPICHNFCNIHDLLTCKIYELLNGETD